MPQWTRWLWLTLGAVALLALAVSRLGDVLLLVALALLIAAGLAPLTALLERHGVRHGLAVPLVFVGMLVAIAAVAALLVPPLLRDMLGLAQALPSSARELERLGLRWEELSGRLPLLPSLSAVTAWLAERATSLARRLPGMAGQAAGMAAAGASIALVAFYVLKDGATMRDYLLKLVPPGQRDDARALLTRLAHQVGRCGLGTLADMALVGALTGLGLWLAGLPNAWALGAIVGLFTLIPFVGALVGATPALIVAFGISPRLGLVTLGVTLLVQQLEGTLIYPRVVGQAVGLHPMVVFLALAVATTLWGVLGVFVAVPAAVVIKVLLSDWVMPAIAHAAPPPPALSDTPVRPAAVTWVASDDRRGQAPVAGPGTQG